MPSLEAQGFTVGYNRKMSWNVYILCCADNSLYTGIAKDVQRRLEEHNRGDKLAAKYTRGRLPVLLVYSESVASRAAAMKREIAIKAMSRHKKMQLINSVS